MKLIAKAAIHLKAQEHGIEPHEILGKRRFKLFTHAKQEVMTILKASGMSYPDVGKVFGLHHTTIMSGEKAVYRRDPYYDVHADLKKVRKYLEKTTEFEPPEIERPTPTTTDPKISRNQLKHLDKLTQRNAFLLGELQRANERAEEYENRMKNREDRAYGVIKLREELDCVKAEKKEVDKELADLKRKYRKMSLLARARQRG